MDDDIEIDYEKAALDRLKIRPDSDSILIAQVYSQLAIARELRLLRESKSTCGHGTVGFCMSCFTANMEGLIPRA